MRASLVGDAGRSRLHALTGGVMIGQHDRRAMPSLSCRFRNDGSSETAIAGTRDPAPAAGRVGLYSLEVDVDFTYLFVVGAAP